MRTRISCVALLVVVSAFSARLVNADTIEKSRKFDKTIRQVVYDDVPTAECMIDFDKANLSKPPAGPQPSSELEAAEYFKETGFDAVGEGDHLVGVQMIAKRVPNSFWDAPKDIDKQLAKEKPKTTLRIGHDGKFPCTFVIETHQGGKGVLRFTKLVPAKDGNPVGLELEYKLLKKAKPGSAEKND